MKKLILGLSGIMLALTAQNAAAFGSTGHRTVADIAEQHLNINARVAIKKIIGKGPLARLASWPDDIKSDKAWNDCSSVWHFFSIDDEETLSKDVPRNEDGDILGVLENFEKVLKGRPGSEPYSCAASESARQSIKWQALAFYVHFVGDIHQPLHVGRRNDYGGNKIAVKWFDDYTNIHSVWDSKILNQKGLSYTAHTEFINHPNNSQLKQWQATDYLEWAQESKDVRGQVYTFNWDRNTLPELSYEYAYNNGDLLDERILKAGVRLAGKLNQIFGQ
jgi:hypothetical protein